MTTNKSSNRLWSSGALKDDQDPPALFASDVNRYGLIETDSSSSSSNPLLSPMQGLTLFAEKQWLNKEIDYLVPVSPAPSVESPIGIHNSNDSVLHVLRHKNEKSVVPANGRINLYHGEDAMTYMVGSFDSFVSRFADSNPLTTTEYLLHGRGKQARIVELAATNSRLGMINEEFTQLSMIAPDDDDDNFDDDLYGGRHRHTKNIVTEYSVKLYCH
eukprot:scaffold91591_cov62-Attheya_sp.AAC.1